MAHLFRQMGNKSVPALLAKIDSSSIVNTFDGGTGAPASAEIAKTLFTQVNTETSNRINGDLAIIGSASADYATLAKIEAVILANEIATAQAIVDAAGAAAGDLDSEIAARIAADTALSNTLTQEIADRTSADTAETSARVSADNGITSTIAQEVSDRAAAITAEASTRSTADIALQDNINAEILARAGAVTAEKDAREASDLVLDGKITTEATARIADVSNVNAAIVLETSSRVAADAAHDTRMSALESGMATGAQLKGTVATLADLDAFVEAEQTEGWFYKVTTGTNGSSDIYMVASSYNGAYDYTPVGWTTKGFIWLMDYADVTNTVTVEKNERILADTELNGKITLLDGVVASNKTVIEATVATLRTDMTNGDSVLNSKVDTEIADRTTAVTNEANIRSAADSVLTTSISDEVTARQGAITLEATTRSEADAVLQTAITNEVTARSTAVTNEASARVAADGILQDNVDAEIAARVLAVSNEVTARGDADTVLGNRLSVVEGTELVDGSVKKALLDAKKYADLYIPVPMLEGVDGSLLVVGDTVTVTYAPHRGLNGIAMGECIVYLANGDSVMVTVLNVVGNVITLATSVADEYAGLAVKIQYTFINADQNGAGMGVAGESGAGL
jgi:hypothetical protein